METGIQIVNWKTMIADSKKNVDQNETGQSLNGCEEGEQGMTGRICFSVEEARKVRAFHAGFSEYSVTPLVSLKALAEEWGVSGIYVKDESARFGLNAFKALGGSYAMGIYAGAEPGTLTFVTATDGNHGRGVAWAAARMGMNSVVYMPKGTARERLDRIRSLGAEASITEMNYDDTVRFARKQAERNGWILIQDTAWDGYTEVPMRIMQGYMTMADEAAEQLGEKRPTHVFLQAGVGSMAAAVAAYFVNRYGEKNRPVLTVVEPQQADCFFRTARADDGILHAVAGDLTTIMAGLACGEINPLAWNILRECTDYFASIPDWVAAGGMRILGNPLAQDQRIISGESGAAPFGLAAWLLQGGRKAWRAADRQEMSNFRRGWKERLGLNRDSVLLFISTEGATDLENYRRIVWEGAYPMPE